MQNPGCPPILRLSTDFGYKRPKVTIQDTFQNEEVMNEKLADYIELVDDEILDVAIGTHVRYITYNLETKKQLFRTGGILHRKFAKYVILMGKECRTFSVQRNIIDPSGKVVYKTRFFKHLTKTEKLDRIIKEESEENSSKDAVIAQQNKQIKELQAQMQALMRGKKK